MKDKDPFLMLIPTLILLFLNINLSYGSRTRDRMYQDITGTGCFRRMNGTHQFGCSSDRRGSTGVVYFIENPSDITNLIKEGTASSYIPILSLEKLTKETVNLLRGSNKISGLVVYKLNETEITEYSHEDTCPNRNFALEGTCDTDWNSPGTNLLNYDFEYPLFLLTNNTELEEVRTCFNTFNNVSLNRHYELSLCSLELNFFMYAVIDTPTCLRRSAPRFNFNTHRVCDPIGSVNIWSSLFPIGNSTINFGNTTHTVNVRSDMKQIVLASRLDATSLFFGKVPGAVNPVTNAVTLLYTSYLLKQMLPQYKDYDKNVLFIFFTGESYDYSGSQRFLYDMEEKQFPMVSDLNPNETALNIFPSNISLFIELNQLGLSESLNTFMQEENTELRNFLTLLKKYAKDININEYNGHIPPASFQTFLKIILIWLEL
ncbi:nicastrin [Holotrichia oblita]|uniref:Nicastrin n=1 Tax=Holotrichia oblita TaxID=644536 RepID=A0ACB9SK30_HOLOL|nr:nicastrin [Holotrichia oblita]